MPAGMPAYMPGWNGNGGFGNVIGEGAGLAIGAGLVGGFGGCGFGGRGRDCERREYWDEEKEILKQAFVGQLQERTDTDGIDKAVEIYGHLQANEKNASENKAAILTQIASGTATNVAAFIQAEKDRVEKAAALAAQIAAGFADARLDRFENAAALSKQVAAFKCDADSKMASIAYEAEANKVYLATKIKETSLNEAAAALAAALADANQQLLVYKLKNRSRNSSPCGH